jgi:hypothetical protein
MDLFLPASLRSMMEIMGPPAEAACGRLPPRGAALAAGQSPLRGACLRAVPGR